MPPDPPSRHAHLHMHERVFVYYNHPAITMFFPSQLKILYETLYTVHVSSLISLSVCSG